MRVDQIAAAEADINEARKRYEDMKAIPKDERNEEQFALLSAAYDSALQNYTGPGVGLEYDDDAWKLNIAESYCTDANGNIVKRDAITGPGVQ